MNKLDDIKKLIAELPQFEQNAIMELIEEHENEVRRQTIRIIAEWETANA